MPAKLRVRIGRNVADVLGVDLNEADEQEHGGALLAGPVGVDVGAEKVFAGGKNN